MQSIWRTVRIVALIVGAVLLAAWGVVLMAGVINGSIDSIRAVLKLMMVIGFMVWIGERIFAVAKN